MLPWSYNNNNNKKKFQCVSNIGKYNSNTAWLKMMDLSYTQENVTCSLSHYYATLILLTSIQGLKLDSEKYDLLILLPQLSGSNFW
jgi:hypothetical protein